MKNNSSLLYSVLLVVGDFLALVAAFVGAYVLRVTIDARPLSAPIESETYLGIFLVLLPFWIMIFALLGLYNSSIQEKRFAEMGRLLVGSFIGLLFLIGYAYILNTPVFPARLVAAYGFGLAFLFLLFFRNLIRRLRSTLYAYNIGITNLLIIGDTPIARELVESLAESKVSGYRIVGIVGENAAQSKTFLGINTFATLDEAVKKIRANRIHSIVQTELFASSSKNNEILEFAQANHVAYRFIPGNTELFVGNIEVELFRSAIPVIAVHQTALIGWGRIVKRAGDLMMGAVALLLALPFMLIIGVLVKLFDPRGSIVHKDSRLTRFGHMTKIYKFRTIKKAYSGMTPEDGFTKMGRPELIKQYRDNGDQLTDDPRVTQIGRFLRRTSLDELPQLINIVKGDISLVGPRALHPHELEKSDKKDLILAVKSGLTGLAQISGRRDISFEERRKLDLYYVQNWSMWLDLTILVKTIRVVLRRSGA
ncbi:sugar transferase [Candidatus Saccharibacteria bacterium]|nr:sugar transferase [Candidatus Saccharibacteria bacterium]